MELAKIQRERAVDAVYQALRQAIVSSLMKPGERLNVDELAQKLGVSLTPVRSAIQQLANAGLVEIRPRSGTFVASLSPQDVEETFEIRCALECLAGEKAIANITPQKIKRLQELLRTLRRPVRNEEDRSTHGRANSDLHRGIVEAAGSRRLLEMYEALNAHIKIARIHSAEANWPMRMEQEESEHEEIVAALENRDARALVAALRKHIYRAKDALVGTLLAK